MTIARVNMDGKPVVIDITNKLSYLTNGKSLTGYHRLRQKQISESNVRFIDYIELVDAFKES